MKKISFLIALMSLLLLKLFSYANVPALEDLLDDTPKEEKIIEHYIKETSQTIFEEENVRDSIFNHLAKKEKGIFLGQEEGICVPQHDLINFFIQYYTTVGRPYLTRSIKQMEIYYPIVEKYIKEIDLPRELAVLGIIESGYNPQALSHKGAMGIWQLMPLTAKIYGLKINGIVDERMDVEKSTRAALLFLKSLAETFNNNWDLVIASYNGGGGYISSQIRKQKESNFWKICQISGFKNETLEFVPRFYAVLHILKNPEKYNLQAPNLSNVLTFENLKIAKTITLKDINQITSIPEYLLKELNPHLKKGVALPSANLFVPRNMGRMVSERINRHRGIVVVKDQGVVIQKRKPAPIVRRKTPSKRIVFHKVKRGDTLYKIAAKHKANVAEIKRLNKIKNTNHIKLGSNLRIPVKTTAPTRKVAQRTPRKPVKKASAYKKTTNTKSRVILYQVKRGDTLGKIANQYKVSINDLKKWNNLKNKSTILLGEKLRIYANQPAPATLTYTVKKGDTLYSLAKRFNTTIQTILTYNNLKSGNHLLVGKRIVIPKNS